MNDPINPPHMAQQIQALLGPAVYSALNPREPWRLDGTAALAVVCARLSAPTHTHARTHTHTHTHTNTRTHTHTHARASHTCVCMCVCIQARELQHSEGHDIPQVLICKHACMHVCMCVHVYTCMYVCMHESVFVYTHVCMLYVYAHICMHVCVCVQDAASLAAICEFLLA